MVLLKQVRIKTDRVPEFLTRGKSREEIVEIQGMWNAAKPLLDMFAAKIKSNIEASYEKEESTEIVNSAASLERVVACEIGYRRAYRQMLKYFVGVRNGE